jgi:hypothetical protein
MSDDDDCYVRPRRQQHGQAPRQLAHLLQVFFFFIMFSRLGAISAFTPTLHYSTRHLTTADVYHDFFFLAHRPILKKTWALYFLACLGLIGLGIAAPLGGAPLWRGYFLLDTLSWILFVLSERHARAACSRCVSLRWIGTGEITFLLITFELALA